MKKYNYQKEVLCSNIRRYMKEKKVTARIVAAKLDVTESAFSKYKNGERDISLETLFNLANILEVNVLTLVFGDDAIQYLDSEFINEQLLSDIKAFKECQNDLFKHYHRLKNVADHLLELLESVSRKQVD